MSWSFIKRKRCFYCFKSISSGQCRIVSTVTPADGMTQIQAGKPGKELRPKQKGWKKWRELFSPVLLVGPHYAAELAHLECPNCGRLLPPDFFWLRSYIIAVVGDSKSGKSHYLASLINELRQRQAQQGQYYSQFTPINDEVSRRYKDS